MSQQKDKLRPLFSNSAFSVHRSDFRVPDYAKSFPENFSLVLGGDGIHHSEHAGGDVADAQSAFATASR